MFYIIDKDRFLLEMSHNAKQKGKGVLNWFANLDNNNHKIINFIYDVYGVKYLYMCPELDMGEDIKLYISSEFEIYGLIDEDIFSPKIEEVKPIMTYQEGL